jgi:uncharacterized membrane protein SirB2
MCVAYITSPDATAVPTIVSVVPDTVKFVVGFWITLLITTINPFSENGALLNVKVVALPSPVKLSVVKPEKTSAGNCCPM